MKSFNTNFNSQALVLNSIIYFGKDEQEPIQVRIPTIRDSIKDVDFNVFLSVMFLEVSDYEKMFMRTKATEPAAGIIALIRESKEMRLKLKPYIERYIVGSEVDVRGIVVRDRQLTVEEVSFFRDILLVSFGVKNFDDLNKQKKEEDLSKMSVAERQAYERQKEILQRLENAKKRKQSVKTKDEEIDFPKIVAGVMKEFKLSLEEVKDLNYYTLYYLFSFVFKIDHYDFMKMAAASGNLSKKSKIKHWLE